MELMKELLKKFFEELGLFVNFDIPDEPEEKVKTGEKVIGEMNDLEKGLFTFLDLKEKEHVLLIEEAEKCKTNKEKETELLSKHEKNHMTADLARKIMWTSIRSRFETSKESTAIGIRKGFKVVEVFEKEHHHVGSAMVIPGIRAILTMRM